MGKFAEAKKKIEEEVKASNNKKTFNRSYFDTLGTAMANDPTYERVEQKVKGDKLVEEKTTPMVEFRKGIIGSVAKAAGCDTAEQEKLVQEHQFPLLPVYDFVEGVLSEYLGIGKKFPFKRQENFQASIEMQNVEATVKDVRKPGSGEKSKQRQGAHIKLKAKSTCPSNLKSNI